MIVSRRTALLGSCSGRIMRAAGQTVSQDGLRAIMQRQVDRRMAKLTGDAGTRQISGEARVA